MGPEMVTVPDVRYRSTQDAEKMLTDAGLTYTIEEASEFPLPLNLAAGTDPAAGTQLPKGSQVKLLVT